MKLVGFNIDKIHVEKLSSNYENLKIATKLDVPDITELKQEMFKSKEELLGIKFSFGLDYEPEIAKIELSGSMILAVDHKVSKEVLKQWKDKKIPEDFRLTLFNAILKKSTLRALRLEEEMNLPLHIQLPTLKAEESKS